MGLFASPASSGYQLENYSRLSQTFYQFLGWTIIVTVVGILSFITWIAIGILLYVLEQRSNRASRARLKGIGKSYAREYGLFGSILDFFKAGRQGIRVPIGMETLGGDPTVIP